MTFSCSTDAKPPIPGCQNELSNISQNGNRSSTLTKIQAQDSSDVTKTTEISNKPVKRTFRFKFASSESETGPGTVKSSDVSPLKYSTENSLHIVDYHSVQSSYTTACRGILLNKDAPKRILENTANRNSSDSETDDFSLKSAGTDTLDDVISFTNEDTLFNADNDNVEKKGKSDIKARDACRYENDRYRKIIRELKDEKIIDEDKGTHEKCVKVGTNYSKKNEDLIEQSLTNEDSDDTISYGFQSSPTKDKSFSDFERQCKDTIEKISKELSKTSPSSSVSVDSVESIKNAFFSNSSGSSSEKLSGDSSSNISSNGHDSPRIPSPKNHFQREKPRFSTKISDSDFTVVSELAKRSRRSNTKKRSTKRFREVYQSFEDAKIQVIPTEKEEGFSIKNDEIDSNNTQKTAMKIFQQKPALSSAGERENSDNHTIHIEIIKADTTVIVQIPNEVDEQNSKSPPTKSVACSSPISSISYSLVDRQLVRQQSHMQQTSNSKFPISEAKSPTCVSKATETNDILKTNTNARSLMTCSQSTQTIETEARRQAVDSFTDGKEKTKSTKVQVLLDTLGDLLCHLKHISNNRSNCNSESQSYSSKRNKESKYEVSRRISDESIDFTDYAMKSAYIPSFSSNILSWDSSFDMMDSLAQKFLDSVDRKITDSYKISAGLNPQHAPFSLGNDNYWRFNKTMNKGDTNVQQLVHPSSIPWHNQYSNTSPWVNTNIVRHTQNQGMCTPLTFTNPQLSIGTSSFDWMPETERTMNERPSFTNDYLFSNNNHFRSTDDIYDIFNILTPDERI